MQYLDPASLFSFRYPMGWVYAPERSSTGAVILEHFDPEHAALRVDVFPSAAPSYAEPDAWSVAMERALSDRIAADIALRPLPDGEAASGIERNPSSEQNRRLVAFRGHPVDVAVTVESAKDHDGPFMADTIRLARSSLRWHAPQAGEGYLSERLLGLVWNDWRMGWPPSTRSIVGAAHAIREEAVARSAAEPIFVAALLLDQQLNAIRRVSGGDDPEARLLGRQIAEVRDTMAVVFSRLGLPEPSLGDSAQVAAAHSDLIRHWHASAGDNTAIGTAPLFALALAEQLTYARGKRGTLPHLWAAISDPERVKTGEADVSAEVLDGVGWLASVLADALFEVGERADCQEADSVASAALRLLFAQQPDGELGGTPIRTQLMYRLLASSIHLRANQDPQGIGEANRLRAEVGALDSSGRMTRIHDREDQRVAFDNVMLLASIAPDDPLAGPTSHSRWAQMRLALGDGKAAVAAVAEARHQLARLSLPSHPASVPELVRLGQAGDLYLHLADVCRRLGRTGEALDLLGQAVAHALPVVSGSSFNLMVVASRVYAGVDSALATRWADGAAVIADGLRLSSRPGEDRVRFADSALLQQAYDAAIAGHLDSGDLYAAVSMADRSRGRFLFESIGSGDKSISMVEHLTSELTTPADLLPPALGGPANALLSIESVAEGLGVGAAPVIPEGLPRELDTHRSAVLDAVTRECAATRTPVALSPARVAGMSLYLRNVLLVQESGDDLILFLLGVGAGAGAAAADGHGADAASAYVLSQDAVRHVRVPGCRGRLLKAVKTIQRWMGIHESTRWLDTDDEVPTQDAFNSALADLSELIVAPAARYLVPGAELTVIPSRELGLVPWGLLRDPDGRFLLDRYAITIAPSLSILHMLFERGQRQEPAPFRAYIAADPALDREQLILGDLPYAREEARALWSRLETLGAGSCVRRVGPDATAMSYWAEAAGASLVHLAAHAELAYPAELSVIHLSGGGLAAYQVADVPLASAVVFLAACDTGQGRVSADGVLGLGQSFLQAGAQAVILALTQVNDAVTATLADHFYAALLGGTRNTTVASALQSAVLATRSDLEAGRVIQDDEVIQPDPVAWGAFYMLGHPFARLSFDVAKEP